MDQIEVFSGSSLDSLLLNPPPPIAVARPQRLRRPITVARPPHLLRYGEDGEGGASEADRQGEESVGRQVESAAGVDPGRLPPLHCCGGRRSSARERRPG